MEIPKDEQKIYNLDPEFYKKSKDVIEESIKLSNKFTENYKYLWLKANENATEDEKIEIIKKIKECREIFGKLIQIMDFCINTKDQFEMLIKVQDSLNNFIENNMSKD